MIKEHHPERQIRILKSHTHSHAAAGIVTRGWEIRSYAYVCKAFPKDSRYHPVPACRYAAKTKAAQHGS